MKKTLTILGISLGFFGNILTESYARSPHQMVTILKYGANGYTSYTKPYKQLSLDAATKKFITTQMTRINKDFAKFPKYIYYVTHITISNEKVGRIMFQNQLGGLQAIEIDGSNLCTIDLTANGAMGSCTCQSPGCAPGSAFK